MKLLIVFIASLIGSVIVTFKLTFFKELSGEYVVFVGVHVRRWQKCKRFKNLTFIYFQEVENILRVDNFYGNFDLINFEIQTIKR